MGRTVEILVRILDEALEREQILRNTMERLQNENERLTTELSKLRAEAEKETILIDGILVPMEIQNKIDSFYNNYRKTTPPYDTERFFGKIPTVKFAREQWGWGLKEAKDIVEAVCDC